VQSGDVCGDYDINPIARLQERLGGIDLRLETSRDLAENVDLPFGIETADLADLLQALSVSSVPQRLRSPPPGFIGAGAHTASRRTIHVGQRLSTDDDELQSRLLQTVECDFEIEIVPDCPVDQAVQLRVAQCPPPAPELRTRPDGLGFLARRR